MVLENATNASLVQRVNLAGDLHTMIKGSLEQSGQGWLTTLPGHKLLFFIILVLAAFVVSYGFVWICKTIIKAITKRTETELDDLLLERLQHPVSMSLFILFLNVALQPLSLSNKLAHILFLVLSSVNIILVGTIINRIVSTLIMHFGGKLAAKTESTVDDQLLPIVRRIISVIIYIVTGLCVIANWGINIGPLLAGAGIAGIALAFAMQESLKNVFGGISLVFDKAYGIGERIKLNDGTVGTVVDISLRSTKLRTPTGDLITVPNGKIANENLQNYAQPTHETRVIIPFSVAYGTDIDKVRHVVLDAMKNISGSFERPDDDKKNQVEFLEMGPFSLNFRASFWMKDYTESWDAKLFATERIYQSLVKNNIDIPYPTQSVIIKK